MYIQLVHYISSFWSHIMFSVRNRLKCKSSFTNESWKSYLTSLVTLHLHCMENNSLESNKFWTISFGEQISRFDLRMKLISRDYSWTLLVWILQLIGQYYRALYWNIKKYIKILLEYESCCVRVCVHVNEWWNVMLSTNNTKKVDMLALTYQQSQIVSVSGVTHLHVSLG